MESVLSLVWVLLGSKGENINVKICRGMQGTGKGGEAMESLSCFLCVLLEGGEIYI